MKKEIPQYYLYGETSADKKTNFVHCETLNYRSQSTELNFKPHRHTDFYQVFYLEKGTVQVTLEEKVFEVNGPYILTLPAGTVHGFSYENTTQGYILSVSVAVMANALAPLEQSWRSLLMTQPSNTPLIEIPISSSYIKQQFDRVNHEANTNFTAKYIVISSLLTQIMVMLARQHFEQPATGNDQNISVFDRFHKLVEIHFQEHWSIKHYCDLLGISERGLSRKCHANTGVSSSQFIQSRVMQEAKRLLIHTENSITQVAYLLGFEDPAYFSRYFKKYHGCSPSAYIDEYEGHKTKVTMA